MSEVRQRLGLYFEIYPWNVTATQIVQYFTQLLRHLRRPVVVLWDLCQIHRGGKVAEFCRPGIGGCIWNGFRPTRRSLTPRNMSGRKPSGRSVTRARRISTNCWTWWWRRWVRSNNPRASCPLVWRKR